MTKTEKIAKLLLNELDKSNISETELASRLKISQGTVNKLIKQRVSQPDVKTLQHIASYFNISVATLLFDDILTDEFLVDSPYSRPMFKKEREDPESVVPVKIPVINKVHCGAWVDFTDLNYPAGVADRHEYAPTHDPNAFFVIASGDSMTGSGITEGDLLLVEPAREVMNGSTVLAKGENGCTVKKFQRKGDTIVLSPTNDKYEVMILTEKDVKRDRIRFFRITKIMRDI